jgi:Secretion system C-terminal sorting domain
MLPQLKKLTLLLATYFLSFTFAFSQTAPGIEWQNTIGGIKNDVLPSIIQTNDGGYICGGISNSPISGDKTEGNFDSSLATYDYWVVKISSTGLIQWQKTIGGSGSDYLISVSTTNDNGLICSGWSSSNISGLKTENSIGAGDYWILKLDSVGNIQWQNTIGGTGQDVLVQTIPTDDGYILGGYSISDISGDKTENSDSWDIWIVKIDAVGNIIWQNTISGDESDFFRSIEQTNDGGYICSAVSNSNFGLDKAENCIGELDYWLIKLDSLGSIEWQNTIGGSENDHVYSISQTSNGEYICGGYSMSDSSADKTENNWDTTLTTYDYWIVLLDSNGTIIWENTIGGYFNDNLNSVYENSDGTYILGGHSGSQISGDKTENTWGLQDFWIIKIDSLGNIIWQNSIGGNIGDDCWEVQGTFDQGYLTAGTSSSNLSGDKTENCIGVADYWIIKLYPDTTTSIFNPETSGSSISNINISPNPFTDNLTVSLNTPITSTAPLTISLYDIMGKEVLSQPLSTLNTTLQTAQLSKGVYFVKVGAQIKKVVKVE